MKQGYMMCGFRISLWKMAVSTAPTSAGTFLLAVLIANYEPFKRQVQSHLLALLGAHHILHVSTIRVKSRNIYVLFLYLFSYVKFQLIRLNKVVCVVTVPDSENYSSDRSDKRKHIGVYFLCLFVT